jgi:polysaccharide biosynthesis/export protein
MQQAQIVFFVSVMFFSGVAGAAGQETVKTQTVEPNPAKTVAAEDESYRIGFQDSLEIQVFRHPDLNQRVKVNPDGTIFLYRARGPIAAVCRTERELAETIAKEYLTFLKKPEVNVVAVEKLSQSYGIIGAVEKPGNYFINRRTRLLELLAFAGGPNKDAGSRLIVARTGSSSACRLKADEKNESDELVLMNFKVKDVLENKQNLWMQPGDIVSVLDSDVVYVYGNVNEEGPVKVKEPITLTQAIVNAKGFKPSAKKDKIRVLRQKEGSAEREELLFDLNEIAKRTVQDPILQPNDIVAVSEDSTKAIFRKLGNSLTGGIPSLLYRVP